MRWSFKTFLKAFLKLPNFSQSFTTFLNYLSKLVQCSPFQNFFHPFQNFHPFQPFLDLSKRRWNDLAKVEVRQGRGGLEVSSGKRRFSFDRVGGVQFFSDATFPTLMSRRF